MAFYYPANGTPHNFHKSLGEPTLQNLSLTDNPVNNTNHHQDQVPPIDWDECDQIMGNATTNDTTNNQKFFMPNPLMPSPDSSESSHSSIAPSTNFQSDYISNGGGNLNINVKNEDGNSDLSGFPLDDTDIKRKAQNRAAQRAFRERKEQRVRELEIKLSEAEDTLSKLKAENERLRQENTILATENQVLHSSQRAAAAARSSSINNSNNHPAPQQATFPSHQFYASLRERHEDEEAVSNDKDDDSSVQPSYIVYERTHGETMLGAGAVWQMLMEDPVMSAEDVDINFVVQYIKDKACCDGYGPVYPLREVHEGIRLAKDAKHKS